ncbi:hypothetical protein HMPREF1991_01159 [Hoylesella loescheii DSM 19665 = JCM 12249 = ATCC 15930]|uniref:Uncharacterized protein n=1 Tax=Hoylesella loescheii DSM 19665 = JCM 12249 = ATCC 15930 TaxID=1122985 RepID=A0A069QSF0_HOYLO|nr:hypothetical protein HMPREF1991_01159 [Hoylesella loescheii DSM 19665 = JCM 12249 = ATCC 15930]
MPVTSGLVQNQWYFIQNNMISRKAFACFYQQKSPTYVCDVHT